MLAAFHLFGAPAAVAETAIGREVAHMLAGGTIPKARVVVLDGPAISVTPQSMPDGAVLTTLLGHLAYRLGGKAAWDGIADADASYQGSSTVKLAELLAAYKITGPAWGLAPLAPAQRFAVGRTGERGTRSRNRTCVGRHADAASPVGVQRPSRRPQHDRGCG